MKTSAKDSKANFWTQEGFNFIMMNFTNMIEMRKNYVFPTGDHGSRTIMKMHVEFNGSTVRRKSSNEDRVRLA